MSKTIDEKPEGYTYRQILGQIAGLYGCFVVPNRDDDKILFKWYEDNDLNISEDFDEPQIEDTDINIQMLACNANGAYLTTAYKVWTMQWSCMYMTSDILEQLLTKFAGFTYRIGSFNLLSGNILIDTWDIVPPGAPATVTLHPVHAFVSSWIFCLYLALVVTFF